MADRDRGNRALLARAMPALLRHEGTWRGVYRHFGPDGRLEDAHETEVACRFPEDGPHAYVQHNRFKWADGRVRTSVLPGRLEGDRLWWDVETFHGYAWQTRDDVILLNLTRKDEPGAHFIETIILGATGTHRARTWHWFRDGRLFRRTLCDESRVEG